MATTKTKTPAKLSRNGKQPPAEPMASDPVKKEETAAYRGSIFEWALNILVLLFATAMIAQPFVIPTSSMENTLLVGDHLIVDKLSYAPEGSISKYFLPYTPVRRGDIIVFRYPMNIQENYVKRVIGTPGDHIHLIDKQVFVNGRKLDEPYAVHLPYSVEDYRDNFPAAPPNGLVVDRARQMLAANVVNGELVVPAGYYFAMGDNRENSLDSRYWGLVPRENIIGKPLIVFWSYDAPTEDLASYTLKHVIDLGQHFFTKTRWNRTMKLVHGYPIGN